MNNEQEAQKQTRTPKTTLKLQERIKTLEGVIAKIAHYTGNEKVLEDAGIEKWKPGKGDMKR